MGDSQQSSYPSPHPSRGTGKCGGFGGPCPPSTGPPSAPAATTNAARPLPGRAPSPASARYPAAAPAPPAAARVSTHASRRYTHAAPWPYTPALAASRFMSWICPAW